MDLIDLLLQFGLVTLSIVIFKLFQKCLSARERSNRQPGWSYPLKLLIARYAVRQWKTKSEKLPFQAFPFSEQKRGWDCINIRCTSADGSALLLSIRKLSGEKIIAEATVCVTLPDGITYVLPNHPETTISEWTKNVNGWIAGDLKMMVLDHDNKLRIMYCGALRRVPDGAVQHVRFDFIWSASSRVVRHPEEWDNVSLASTLAREPWRDASWKTLLNSCEENQWYQWGAVQGRFRSYNDGVIEKDVYLRVRGLNERLWTTHSRRDLLYSVAINCTARDGTALLLNAVKYRNTTTEFVSGSIRYPNYLVEPITYNDFSMSAFENSEGLPNVQVVNLSTKSRSVKLVLRLQATPMVVWCGWPQRFQVTVRQITADIDLEPATGQVELAHEVIDKSELNVKLSPAPSLQFRDKCSGIQYCVPFEAPEATCPKLVGGKGASLALLASVQNEYKVPPGFCITNTAFMKNFRKNPELQKAVQEIEKTDIINTNEFKEKCEIAVKLFMETEIKGHLKYEILTHLHELRNNPKSKKLKPLTFAVRSSALYEDSETLSAAGQNETILGCFSDEQVLKAVQQCWGSFFSFNSATYRRMNGQECMCGGGVVVQTVVSARASGVLFTRRPPIADVTAMLLTANYGLGESVVSGEIEADSVVIKRVHGDFEIAEITIGSKKQQHIIKMQEPNEPVLVVEDVDLVKRDLVCLSKEDILRLAKIGALQEELWGNSRDLEWAIFEEDIYLLQSRPLTGLEAWSPELLLHELDHPIMADDELLTIANVGEVLPKPISVLTYDLITKLIDKGLRKNLRVKDEYECSFALTHNRLCLLLYNTLYRTFPAKIDLSIRMMEMGVHGHAVADERIARVAHRRRRPRAFTALVELCRMIMSMIKSDRCTKDSERQVRDMKIADSDNIKMLLDTIWDRNQDMQSLCDNHLVTSSASSFSQILGMIFLMEDKTEMTAEHYNELSTLLNAGQVLSAEVPIALNKLSEKWEQTRHPKDVDIIPPHLAFYWIQSNLPDFHNEIKDFLEKHGHRSVMEMDLATKPWALAPETLMKVLQNYRCDKTRLLQINTNNEEVTEALLSSKKLIVRTLLRVLLPLCRQKVRQRESTKSSLVQGIHKIRTMLLRLADVLVRNWYLPDPDLIFHFRMHELKHFINTRDAALLRKAVQRKQCYPQWCELEFPEIMEGWPQPLVRQQSYPLVEEVGFVVKATPVCGGEVVARACVIQNTSQISQLQQGDILVTVATDIGWSPYFPMLSGIVTELGGLLSHGAVIAREYGLPCVVGVGEAARRFATGDTLRLSGSRGTIELLRRNTDAHKSTDQTDRSEVY